LNPARGAFQFSQLFAEEGESVLDLNRVLNRKCNPWKLEKVVTDRFGDVKTGFAENAAEPNDSRRSLSRKIHEFHRYLL
jgi:hypothetical protein